MAKPPCPRAGPRAAARIAVRRLLIALLLAPVAATPLAEQADGRGRNTLAPRTGKLGLGALDNAAAHVKALPAMADRSALAAQATQEGHWRFVNKAGETFTAGTPDELKRVASVLLPDAKADAKLALYVTEDTIFLNRAALKDLPAGTELYVVVGRESYRILRRATARPSASMRRCARTSWSRCRTARRSTRRCGS